MECDGSERTAGAVRIPIQFVANSAASTSSLNKQVEEHELRQPRCRHRHLQQQHLHQQQQRSATSAGDNHVSSVNGRLHGPPPRPSLSKHSADSVETVFRQREPGLRPRAESTTSVRPLTVMCRSDRDRRSRLRARPADERATRSRVQSDSAGRTASSGAGDSSRRSVVTPSGCSGGGYSSEDDSADDSGSIMSQTRSTSTRSPGADSSTPRTFHVEFDVEGYSAEDLSVRVNAGRRLVVNGVRRKTDGGRTSTTEFCRKIRLPDDVDPTRLDCCLQPDGRVVIEAPRRAAAAGDRTQMAGEPLNVPVVTGDDRRQLGLLVEVGRMFRADDVVVKVKNSALVLTVAAERTEQTAVSGGDGGRLKASVTWEFDLPAAVDVDTLRAGLTVDGLLRVTARLVSPLPLPPSVVNSTV